MKRYQQQNTLFDDFGAEKWGEENWRMTVCCSDRKQKNAHKYVDRLYFVIDLCIQRTIDRWKTDQSQ